MSIETEIEALVRKLAGQVAPNCVTNPYSKPELASNLRAYFSLLVSYPYSGHLLVGEAPGFKGCAQCGIPFTSQRVINERRHPFLVALREKLAVDGNQAEVTATKVWNQLEGKNSVPAFWNTFPFHPWVAGNPEKNRRPTTLETAIGLEYLDMVKEILKPHTVIAVGGVASRLLRGRYPSLRYREFSHPSMRGYPGFLAGFAKLGLE